MTRYCLVGPQYNSNHWLQSHVRLSASALNVVAHYIMKEVYNVVSKGRRKSVKKKEKKEEKRNEVDYKASTAMTLTLGCRYLMAAVCTHRVYNTNDKTQTTVQEQNTIGLHRVT